VDLPGGVLLSFGFMTAISVAFDFGECLDPSRVMPHMTLYNCSI